MVLPRGVSWHEPCQPRRHAWLSAVNSESHAGEAMYHRHHASRMRYRWSFRKYAFAAPPPLFSLVALNWHARVNGQMVQQLWHIWHQIGMDIVPVAYGSRSTGHWVLFGKLGGFTNGRGREMDGSMAVKLLCYFRGMRCISPVSYPWAWVRGVGLACGTRRRTNTPHLAWSPDSATDSEIAVGT